jgi:DNA-binding transcriptional regulator YiaG
MGALDVAIERVRVRRRLPPPSARQLLRRRAGLSQNEIAAALGVTREAVALWEAGRRTPRPATASAYLAILERLAAEVTGR